MGKMTLYTSNDEGLHDPEGELCWAPLAEYDPRDRSSLRRARAAVKDHFSLTYLPVLCSEPEPSWSDALLRAAGRWVERRAPWLSKRTARVAA